ncbi:transglutaminase domain-containing protein [uncultured Maribacter sp.]|uniref:transglutaminase domain-containing protein n=1 Tax=uncultured Maribacter sp. TaxID=431308 RepID=UPI00260C0B94|nr:transglutaminase domain-containing protein [uncultured Maribacter sp.]
MKHLYSISCLFFLFYTSIYSQKNVSPLPQDIEKADSFKEIYPEDNVVIVNSTEKITFDYNEKTQLVTVEKDLNEELMNINERSDIQKYVFYDNTSSVTVFNTRYRNSKVVHFPKKDEFYTSGDIFYNDARVKYMAIDFPVKGFKYLFHLKKEYTDSKYFTQVSLIDEYPTINKSVSFMVPDWLHVDLLEFNFDGFEIEKEEKYNDKLKATEHIFTIKNIPSLTDESNTPGPSKINPHILVVAKSMQKDGQTITLFSETKQLYSWYKSLVDSMDEDTTILKSKVNQLTKNATTEEEKIKNIYYWVQDNIRYIAFEDGIAGFKPDESQNVFKKRYGDCKGMANLTKQMLKIAGFDARLTWIGTKRIGYDYSIPSLAVDNHMICTLLHNGKRYFLDSTEKYNSFGSYAERIQGRPVLIENGEEYILDTVPVENVAQNKKSTVMELHIADEALEGTVKQVFAGESRASLLNGYNALKDHKKEEVLKYYLTNGDKNCGINSIETSNLEDRDNTININYNISLKNKVSTYEDDIYIDLEYGKHYKNIDLSKRNHDLEFPYKANVEFTTILHLPKGYYVKNMPKGINHKTEDFNVAISFTEKANTIIYTKKFIFKNAAITKASFTEWNTVSSALKKIYKEQIVVTKNQKLTSR